MATIIISILLAMLAFKYQIYDAGFIFLMMTVTLVWIYPVTLGIKREKQAQRKPTTATGALPLVILVPLKIMECIVSLAFGMLGILFESKNKDH